MKWINGLLERRSKVRTELGPVAPPTSSTTQASSSAEPQQGADAEAAFFEWMLDAGAMRADAINPLERRALAFIDQRLHDGRLEGLLTRVPAGIPHLLSSLRDEELAFSTLRDQIAKDLMLTAEALRLANSAHYRPNDRPPVADLDRAMAVLGRAGLRNAVAHVLLRPMFDQQSGRLTQRTARRLWEHAERKATLSAALAAARGIAAFDAYLAGLAHNAGWSAAWRILDRETNELRLPFSFGFLHELRWRSDRLFGNVVASWQIAPTLTQLGIEVRRTALAGTESPLGPLLLEADRVASGELAVPAEVP